MPFVKDDLIHFQKEDNSWVGTFFIQLLYIKIINFSLDGHTRAGLFESRLTLTQD